MRSRIPSGRPLNHPRQRHKNQIFGGCAGARLPGRRHSRLRGPAARCTGGDVVNVRLESENGRMQPDCHWLPYKFALYRDATTRADKPFTYGMRSAHHAVGRWPKTSATEPSRGRPVRVVRGRPEHRGRTSPPWRGTDGTIDGAACLRPCHGGRRADVSQIILAVPAVEPPTPASERRPGGGGYAR